ncbi:MAG TPA: hypothetical protein VH247_06170 [Thermoleophilaceae bacterium]|nr:hypothetical protein [Thermoleophilaceae bacterium]
MTDVADYERQFRRAGLPLFIEDYTASEDVFTRAVPVLAFVFIAEMLGAIQLDWSPVANVAAALGGLAILVGTFALLNGLRGRRRLALPERIGRTELVLFVLLPALLPLIFGGQARSAIGTAAGNLLLLGLVERRALDVHEPCAAGARRVGGDGRLLRPVRGDRDPARGAAHVDRDERQ